jgi:hypothetical protein
MNNTEIHAVELVREIRDQLYQETRHMSPDEFQTFIASEATRAARLHTQRSLGANQPAARSSG